MGRKIGVFGAFSALVLAYYTFYREEHFDPDVLKGRNVVLTGASSGIGEQMAYYYAKHGANLLITARRENLLKKVTEKCRSLAGKGVTIDYIKADMGNMEEARHVVKRAFTVLGGIDHLMLNHGMFIQLKAWKGSDENKAELNKCMQVNFQSLVEITSAALSNLMERNGTITFTSSILGRIPGGNFIPYSTTKFASEGFFGGLREELQDRQANVSITIAPLGPVETDMSKSVQPGPDMSTTFMNIKTVKIIGRTKPGEAAECAKEIIKGTVLRHSEIFYPPSWTQHVVIILQHLCPSCLEFILRW